MEGKEVRARAAAAATVAAASARERERARGSLALPAASRRRASPRLLARPQRALARQPLTAACTIAPLSPLPLPSPLLSQMGAFELTAGEIGVDTGIKTSTDARHYSISAPLASEISNKGKDLIVSFTVRHDQVLDCGGAYIKLLTPGLDQAKFSGDDKYAIMFGPDMCGTSTRKTHVILTYNGKNLLTKKNVRMESDQLSHVYTLILKADNTYEVQIDTVKAESGSLYDDWDFLLPKKIKDPKESKPKDWVDDAQMPDPADVKPAGYDDIPAKIPDAAAKIPEDWDVEEDGEWTAPQVDNPAYKGPWKAKQIANPAYKGVWVRRCVFAWRHARRNR